MKRVLTLSILAALVVGLVAGCGAPKATQPAANKTVTITYARVKDPTPATQQLLAKFQEENPNIKVNYVEMPAKSDAVHDDFVTKLSAGDTSVDVMTLDVVWPAEFASAGWTLPIDQYMTQDELNKYLPGPLESNRLNGKLYGLPGWTDAGVLYYRKDILDKAGKQPPKTWAELISLSKELAGKNGVDYGIVFQGDQYEGLVCTALELMRGNGGEVLADGKIVVNDPKNVEAIKIMRSLVTDKIAPEGVTTYKEADALRVFLEGKSLFMRNWPYAWAQAQNAPESKVKGMVGIVPVPMGPSGTKPSATLGGWDLAINGKIPEERKQAAVTFLKWMTGPEAQKINALVGGKLPIQKETYSDADVLKANPHYKSLYDVFINAQPRPVTPVYPQLSDAMQINLHKAITGQMSAEDAAKNMQDSMQKALK